MKILKLLSITLFVLFSVSFAQHTLAQTISFGKTSGESQENLIVSNIDIVRPNIISQEGNIFNISFILANKEQAQPNIKYGFQLTKGTGSTYTVVDEYVYDEVLTLTQNTITKKVVTYTAPSNISGEYKLNIFVQNSSGKIIAFVPLSDVKLTAINKTAEIISDTCYLSVASESAKYKLNKGVDIKVDEELKLNCEIVNNSKDQVSLIPSYETHLYTLSGKIVDQVSEGDTNSISLKAGEKKSVSIMLPKATIPQTYTVKINFKIGDIDTNSVFAKYIISGVSASIDFLSIDKDFYKRGDNMNVSFAWSPSSYSVMGSRLKTVEMPDAKLFMTVKNKIGFNCIKPIENTLDNSTLNSLMNFKVKNKCIDPKITATIKDGSGNILDEKVYNIKTTSVDTKSNNKILYAIIILVLAICALVLTYMKKKNIFSKNLNNKNNPIDLDHSTAGDSSTISPKTDLGSKEIKETKDNGTIMKIIFPFFMILALVGIFGSSKAEAIDSSYCYQLSGGTYMSSQVLYQSEVLENEGLSQVDGTHCTGTDVIVDTNTSAGGSISIPSSTIDIRLDYGEGASITYDDSYVQEADNTISSSVVESGSSSSVISGVKLTVNPNINQKITVTPNSGYRINYIKINNTYTHVDTLVNYEINSGLAGTSKTIVVGIGQANPFYDQRYLLTSNINSPLHSGDNMDVSYSVSGNDASTLPNGSAISIVGHIDTDIANKKTTSGSVSDGSTYNLSFTAPTVSQLEEHTLNNEVTISLPFYHTTTGVMIGNVTEDTLMKMLGAWTETDSNGTTYFTDDGYRRIYLYNGTPMYSLKSSFTHKFNVNVPPSVGLSLTEIDTNGNSLGEILTSTGTAKLSSTDNFSGLRSAESVPAGTKVQIHWEAKGFDESSIICTMPDGNPEPKGLWRSDYLIPSLDKTTKYSITCEDIYTVAPSVTPITPTDSPDTPPSTIVVHNAYNSTGNTNKPSGTGFIYNPLYNGGGKNVYITWITGKNYDYCTDITHNVSGGKDISFQNSGENLKSWTWSGNVWSDINGETRIRCNSLLRGGVDDTFYYDFSHCTDDGVPCSLIKYE